MKRANCERQAKWSSTRKPRTRLSRGQIQGAIERISRKVETRGASANGRPCGGSVDGRGTTKGRVGTRAVYEDVEGY
eukprot:6194607-Pleurochrysis_carterae.AAC.5